MNISGSKEQIVNWNVELESAYTENHVISDQTNKVGIFATNSYLEESEVGNSIGKWNCCLYI